MKKNPESSDLDLSKKLVILLMSLFFSIQVFEALYSRQDYPFTAWGMYSSLPQYKKYFTVVVESKIDGKIVEACVNPWRQKRQVLTSLGLEKDYLNPRLSIEEYKQKVVENIKINEIESILKENIFKQYSGRVQMEIFFYAWEKLKSSNINQPDITYQIYPGENDSL